MLAAPARRLCSLLAPNQMHISLASEQQLNPGDPGRVDRKVKFLFETLRIKWQQVDFWLRMEK